MIGVDSNITNGYRNRDWYREHVWYGTGDTIESAHRRARAAYEKARQAREEIRELVARIHYDAIEKARALARLRGPDSIWQRPRAPKCLPRSPMHLARSSGQRASARMPLRARRYRCNVAELPKAKR